MKHFLTLLLIFSLNIAKSQPYQKLIRQNIYWEQFSWDASTICNTTFGMRLFFSGDTLINSLTYSKIYGYLISPLNQPAPFCAPFGVDTSQAYLATWYVLREDTADRKVYIYDFNNLSEFLLYDFALQVGDTFVSQYTTNNQPFIIDSIKYITTYDGINRRIFYGNQIVGPPAKYILEGIGSSSGLYAPMFDAIGAGYWLTCVLDQNTPILPPIHPSGFTTCSQIVGLNEYGLGFNVTIKPNPSNGIVTIEHSYIGGCTISVYEPNGKLIYSKYSDQQSVLLDLSNCSDGIYLIELADQNQRIYLNKIVIVKD